MATKIKDFATGKWVDISKPEEEVRQAYERILVNDFGYPKSALDIEVGIQMGSSRKECDIAVYDTDRKKGNIVGIIEVKAPNVKIGKKHFGQHKSYMSATVSCTWGVLTNGEETHYANKKNGEIEFSPAIRVPRYNEKGAVLLSYDALVEASNLKWTFKHINQRLYANTNLPRKEKQGAEMSRLIFCKLTDEYNGELKKSDIPAFQIKEGESDRELRKRINQLWDETKRGLLGESIFDKSEKIQIDDYSLKLIVSLLQDYALLKTDKDVVGDAFEVFAERQFAGDKGQFFTPRNVVNMVIEMIDPQQNDTIIDPACGSGGFLTAAFNHMTKNIPKNKSDIRGKIAQHSLYGIDKDADLVKICKAQMAIMGDGKSNIVQADSLKDPKEWDDVTTSKLLENGEPKQFDIVITNPPFGSKIKVDREEVLQNYELGHKWKMKNGNLEKTDITSPTPPQVLFIEKCLNLLKDGGKLGIVLPDGLLGNTGDIYIRQHIKDRAKVLAVIDCPVATFMPHTGTKTSVLILQKEATRNEKIFFAVAENCGHTMRGKAIGRNDFEPITANYIKTQTGKNLKQSHLGFFSKPIDKRLILVPRYYDPRILKEIKNFDAGGYEMTSVGKLIEDGTISVKTVQNSASAEDYVIDGDVRFVRTSDISGYEISGKTQKTIMMETYNAKKCKQDLQRGDILFIKDGDTKIGECAILLTDNDLRISVQSHFYKIRPDKMDEFLLLWALNHPIVKKQIRQRVFSQSTLSTIGERINELKLPIPKQESKVNRIINVVEECIRERRDRLNEINKVLNQ